MENKEFYADQFIVYLTIDCTNIEETEVEITDITRSLREQVDSIVKIFELPKMDTGGNINNWLLGKVEEENYYEHVVFDFADEDGRELTLDDYGVEPGDHLFLTILAFPG